MTVDRTEATARRAALITALAACGAGDREAFRQIYDMTAAKLFGICLRICGERQVAEDVLQEVYLIIWKRAPAYDAARGSPITWLCVIARNRALDWRRSKQAHHAAVNDEVDGGKIAAIADETALADDALMLAQERERLHRCINQLDDRPRAAIYSAFLDGLTYVEVAERAAVPLPTMKSLIRRALLRLRECLRDDG
ncbi:sigma-70 family RNA polymerase sigma factor [uncultured Sphingomonas sp.]|uniref:sigma-70 family RNA polymerase sigma factor n=1 Tax=uncultured Sphingomonas sp. TaxID=158754 RepID=UPI0025F4CB28|nr:sigma-70 family RNA polymerase sigma factor [uncultured Sphingomonas sp.]